MERKKRRKNSQWIEVLEEAGACEEALRWCRKQPSMYAAWKACITPGWFEFILDRLDLHSHRVYVIMGRWLDDAEDIFTLDSSGEYVPRMKYVKIHKEYASEIRAIYPWKRIQKAFKKLEKDLKTRKDPKTRPDCSRYD